MVNKKRTPRGKAISTFPVLEPLAPTQPTSDDVLENPEFCKKLIASIVSEENPNQRISISIAIGHLSSDARRSAPAHLGITSPKSSQDKGKHCEGMSSDIIVELKAPALLRGDLHEYGASLFALGRIGLEFARNELARKGFTKADLDLLTTDHVSIISAPATYTFCCDEQKDATELSLALNRHSKLLGLTSTYGNPPFTVEFRRALQSHDCAITNTPNESVDHNTDEIVITKSFRPGRHVLQLEVNLDGTYLTRRNWTPLNSWRNAYAENRYEQIFDEMVRGLFGLDVVTEYASPVIKPNKHGLVSREDAILRDYLDGKKSMALSDFSPFMSDHEKKKAMDNIRMSILQEWGIDIRIDWQTHRTLRPSFLNAKLRYPGDFQPEAKFVPSHFCRLNFKYILQKLRQDYDDLTSEGLAGGGVK